VIEVYHKTGYNIHGTKYNGTKYNIHGSWNKHNHKTLGNAESFVCSS